MFNEVLTLISSGEITHDKIGNPVKNEQRRDILCQTRSVTRQEYYNYGIAERIPEIVVIVNKCEYFGESDCEFRGRRYFIRRTYELDRDLIELTLEKGLNQNGKR